MGDKAKCCFFTVANYTDRIAVKNLFPFLLVLFALGSCQNETVRMEGFSVHGVDVSHYQGKVNWTTVAEQDIRFAFLKATEGLTYQDSFFQRNWAQLDTLDIYRGAYHYFHADRSAQHQAFNFIQTVRLFPGDMPPVVDVEVTKDASPTELRRKLQTWLTMVEIHYQRRPIIYTYQNFYNEYLSGYFDDYPIWIARYNQHQTPELKDDQRWHFWQYGERGSVAGIRGPVDLNVFRGSVSDFEFFIHDNTPALTLR